MSPKRHSTDVFRETKRQRSAKDLAKNPESQIGDSGQLDKQRKEKDWNKRDNTGGGKEKEIGAEHPSDRTGSSHGREGRIRIGEKMHQPCRQAANKIENKKAQRPHAVLHVVAEDPQRPHIADDVEPAAVKEHARNERPVVIEWKAHQNCPVGMRITRRDHAKIVERSAERRVGTE